MSLDTIVNLLLSVALDLILSVKTIFVLMICGFVWQWRKKPHPRFPPGPVGIPLVGAVPFINNKYVERAVKKWSLDKYGPVMSVKLAGRYVVYLNDFEAVNQAFVKQGASLSGRPMLYIFRNTIENFGIVLKDYSEAFKTQKSFGLNFLKTCGMGKKGMENMINAELQFFIDYLQTADGKPVDLQFGLKNLIANIIAKVVLGRRYDYDDLAFRKILQALQNQLGNPEHGPKIFMLEFFPFLRKIPPFPQVLKGFEQLEQSTLDCLHPIIEEHRQTFDRNDIRDFIDAYLYEQKHGIGQNNTDFSDKQLLVFVRDLFVAGTETTSGSLYWALLCLLHFPKSYETIMDEIDRVLANENTPTCSMRGNMPYTCAFIQEVWRYCVIVPFGVPHECQSGVELLGYHIPKGTELLANIWGVHHDPGTWANPEVFDPRRHIDQDGKFIHSYKIIPFSCGPRYCLGEKLARMEMFLVLVKLLKTFHISASSSTLPSFRDGKLSVMNWPESYQVVLKLR